MRVGDMRECLVRWIPGCIGIDPMTSLKGIPVLQGIGRSRTDTIEPTLETVDAERAKE
jgi:hypothetical protein